MLAEDHCPEGKVVIRYDDGPEGEFVGFEVVTIKNERTPLLLARHVGRRLAIPPGADDCRAVLVSNFEDDGTLTAWQRGFESADVYAIRPEFDPSKFVKEDNTQTN